MSVAGLQGTPGHGHKLHPDLVPPPGGQRWLRSMGPVTAPSPPEGPRHQEAAWDDEGCIKGWAPRGGHHGHVLGFQQILPQKGGAALPVAEYEAPVVSSIPRKRTEGLVTRIWIWVRDANRCCEQLGKIWHPKIPRGESSPASSPCLLLKAERLSTPNGTTGGAAAPPPRAASSRVASGPCSILLLQAHPSPCDECRIRGSTATELSFSPGTPRWAQSKHLQHQGLCRGWHPVLGSAGNGTKTPLSRRWRMESK